MTAEAMAAPRSITPAMTMPQPAAWKGRQYGSSFLSNTSDISGVMQSVLKKSR